MMKALEIVNGAERKGRDSGYILKAILIIPVWTLRMKRDRKKEKERRKEKDGKRREGEK